MRYLLDTHTLIWYYDDYAVLPKKALEIIENPANELYVCAVSLWEISIKKNIGKLNLSLSIDDFYALLNESPLNIINIEQKHLNVYTTLKLIHRDPFDRLLVSTAISENLTIITHDKNIKKYKVQWMWRK